MRIVADRQRIESSRRRRDARLVASGRGAWIASPPGCVPAAVQVRLRLPPLTPGHTGLWMCGQVDRAGEVVDGDRRSGVRLRDADGCRRRRSDRAVSRCRRDPPRQSGAVRSAAVAFVAADSGQRTAARRAAIARGARCAAARTEHRSRPRLADANERSIARPCLRVAPPDCQGRCATRSTTNLAGNKAFGDRRVAGLLFASAERSEWSGGFRRGQLQSCNASVVVFRRFRFRNCVESAIRSRINRLGGTIQSSEPRPECASCGMRKG